MTERNVGTMFVRIDDDTLRTEVARIFPVYPKMIGDVSGVMVSNGDASVVEQYLKDPKGFDKRAYLEGQGMFRHRSLSASRASVATAFDGRPIVGSMPGKSSTLAGGNEPKYKETFDRYYGDANPTRGE